MPFAQRVLGDIGAISQLPEILRKVSADPPQLIIEVEIGVSSDLVPRVRNLELDIARVVGPVLERSASLSGKSRCRGSRLDRNGRKSR